MHRFSHLVFLSSPGPGPAFLGLLGRPASPQFLVEAEGDCSKSQVCSRGAVITCTCPSDHEPFLAAGRMYVVPGLRNALSPEPHWKQPHSVSNVLRTETDWIQATFGRGLGAGWLLRWSLLPPSGHTAHRLLLEASGSGAEMVPTLGCQSSGFPSGGRLCGSVSLSGLACTYHIRCQECLHPASLEEMGVTWGESRKRGQLQIFFITNPRGAMQSRATSH